jgi:uncharacterized membrane protein YebE (DUF533 family)
MAFRNSSIASLPGRSGRVSRDKDPQEERNDQLLRLLAGAAPLAGGAIGAGLGAAFGGPAGAAAGLSAGGALGGAAGNLLGQQEQEGHERDEEDRELKRQQRLMAVMGLLR